MALTNFQALQFRRPMERGLNKPVLVVGQSLANGERKTLVVKCRAGYGNRQDAMVKELFALLLARHLNLATVEPVIVNIARGFEWGAADYPEYQEIIRASQGWNFGTVHLGEGWKPWSRGSAPRSLSPDTIEASYAFDAMVENPDRGADNPNLLWRGEVLALLDFDRAFSFLRDGVSEPQPWRKSQVRLGLERHCLFPHLRGAKEREILGIPLWDAFQTWWQEREDGELFPVIGQFFDDSGGDLPLLAEYATKLATGMEDFFRTLTDATRL